MRSVFRLALLALVALPSIAPVRGAPRYTIDDVVRLAQDQNPEIAIARKKIQAAHGGQVEARSGYLPSVVSSGLYRRREDAESTRLRPDDYSTSVRVVQNLYTGGATSNQVAIAQLNLAKQQDEFETVTDRVTMDVRLAFYELLLNREKILVREQSVGVLREELKSQRERLSAGTVGPLDASRAEVALANEEPELVQAQTDLRNSYLHLSDLCGIDARSSGEPQFEAVGTLQYEPRHPDLDATLARALAERPEIRSAQKDVAIEEKQLEIDRSATRPHVEFFTGYEVYSERDPLVGPEFNHGYVVGLNGSWALFDGYATRGRMEATRARRDGALLALKAVKLGIESEVRSAFLDLQQADSVLQAQSKNVQTADDALTFAKSNFAAGLGTQLDVLQAAADVTRTRTTRLSAIYLHNAALARLDRASSRDSATLAFEVRSTKADQPKGAAAGEQVFQFARPPSSLGQGK
ncbi:MAG TPA: TolC family protein [Chthoniobacterales bacterium]|nr:TolC family protein [Chthoniobacterales bacterium]